MKRWEIGIVGSIRIIEVTVAERTMRSQFILPPPYLTYEFNDDFNDDFD